MLFLWMATPQLYAGQIGFLFSGWLCLSLSCLQLCTRSANSALVTFTRSFGESLICAPIFPAET